MSISQQNPRCFFVSSTSVSAENLSSTETQPVWMPRHEARQQGVLQGLSSAGEAATLSHRPSVPLSVGEAPISNKRVHKVGPPTSYNLGL